MFKIGLSGNRYSGQDKVCKEFEEITIPVFHADIILKFIIKYSLDVDKKIIREFGHSFSNPNLSDVFSNSEKINTIIDFAEDELFQSYEKFQKKNSQSIYTIFHSSILVERNWNQHMDYNISVFAPKEERIKRALKDSSLSREIIYKLASTEVDEITKNNVADYVIHSYLGFSTKSQIDKIDKTLIREFLKKIKK